jgi:Ca2+-binding RTX toxin-like protein
MRVLLCTAIALAFSVASAEAAVVRGYGDGEGFLADVQDTRGERNRLVVTVSPSFTKITVRDTAASRTLRAQGACRLRAEGVVTCPLGFDFPDAMINVRAGNADDTVLVRSEDAIVTVFGGRGNDRLRHVRRYSSALTFRGGPGDDILTGSYGNDDLFGGAGSDALRGARGNDVLSGDAGPRRGSEAERVGDDTLDGGRGNDQASWGERRTGVRVDLRRGLQRGYRGERDVLRSVEGAAGGAARDMLLGDGGPNRLLGRRGADTLVGRGGDDVLGAGARGARLFSGPVGRARDVLRCGRGDDLVTDPGLDPLPPTCERISVSDYGVLGEMIPAQPRRLGRNRLAFTVACPTTEVCRRRVVLMARGKELGRSPIRPVKRATLRLVVRLRRPLPRRGLVTVRLEDPNGKRRFAWRLQRG